MLQSKEDLRLISALATGLIAAISGSNYILILVVCLMSLYLCSHLRIIFVAFG
jgi:hypothetical protein